MTGLEAGDAIIKLTYPLTMQKIVYPAKGKKCAHTAAFDLAVIF